MFAPYVPVREDFEIYQGSLGVYTFIRGPMEICHGTVVVESIEEAERFITTAIDKERQHADYLLSIPGILF